MFPRNSRLLEQHYTLSDGKHNSNIPVTSYLTHNIMFLGTLYSRTLVLLVSVGYRTSIKFDAISIGLPAFSRSPYDFDILDFFLSFSV